MSRPQPPARAPSVDSAMSSASEGRGPVFEQHHAPATTEQNAVFAEKRVRMLQLVERLCNRVVNWRYETHLLLSKLDTTKAHLRQLKKRIEDTRSRVLVTGDLNGGKSTFVVPSDQQPCTALFTEVVDAVQNRGKEEVHGIKDASKYNPLDPDTYTPFAVSKLREVVEDNEEGYEMLKVYCHDARNSKEESVLHNGIVDISLIDSPEEIDVIVFVVNAENHFTLSVKRWKRKAYVFVVVNRFDQIRRKDRCKRDILSQISEISPLTFQSADQLVHFRARSKLNPAKLFLGNLLRDMSVLCSYNHTLSLIKSAEISTQLSDSAPAYERMLRIKEQFLDDVDRTIEETASRAHAFARDQLSNFLEDIEWGGVLGMWQYARDLRNAVYGLRLFAVKSSVGCVKNIEAMAESCMESAPKVNMEVVTTAFEDGSAEAGRAAAMSMFVPMELGDFFDVMDKIEIIKEYIPSLSMLVGGLFGYHSVTRGMWKNDQMMVRGKTAFLGLSMAGVGLFLYSLSDMKTIVDRKVLSKIKSHLINVGLVDANSERIAKGTRRVLKLAIWEFQNQFQRVLIDSQSTRQNLVELRTKAELNKDEFRALGARVDTLKRIVDAVDLD
ncbi:hypothetical protein BCR33DRAFT_755208 [Rhizoclosmatium globosum]|uniref:Dynamin-type G domain-containing protein n=1 Tax=Rhizoclosmatium globosum TaxID=329046 RepID=A0A1Y2B6I4_9FUNG|nr:hypothetical protein BCR33DRAFT_755208 [Rhizoclosmatium globosum]|eukprot:ORY30452.1 hypothetical protein BCR33DRAFT_755208 [Rhizoclosmatium globosum]